MNISTGSPMIHVPLKRTEQIDWGPPIRKLIQSHFSDDPAKYSEEIAHLNKLRQDTRGTASEQTGRDLLLRYYSQLLILDLRFPFDDKTTSISFPWYDAFSAVKIKQQSLAYEKACVLFNLGCMFSAMASHASRANVQGLKQSYQNFQLAAGVFGFISEKFLHAPSSDMQRDSIQIIQSTMLAQAQECFWEKTVQEKRKTMNQGSPMTATAPTSPGGTPIITGLGTGSSMMVVKITAGTAQMYEKLWDLLNGTSSAGGNTSLDEGNTKAKFDKGWINLVQVKWKFYSSLVHYHRALVCEEKRIYGEFVGRLRNADSLAKEAYKLAQSSQSSFSAKSECLTSDTASTILEICKSASAQISRAAAQSEKDNDLVYHEPVIPPDNLPAIEKIIVAEAKPLSEAQQELHTLVGKPLFDKLMPLSVHEKSSMYSELKDDLIRKQSSRVHQAQAEVISAIEAMGLPQALVALKEPNSLSDELVMMPKAVEECIDMVHIKEHTESRLGDLVDTLQALKDRAKQVLDEVGIELDRDHADCEQGRMAFGDRWSQAPSDQMTIEISRTLAQHRATFTSASTQDLQTLSQYNQHVKPLTDSMLIGTVAVLREFAGILSQVQGSNSSGTPGDKEQNLLNLMDQEEIPEPDLPTPEQARQVSDAMAKAHNQRKQLMEKLEDFRKKVRNDDITEILFLNKDTLADNAEAESAVFKQELDKFEPLIADLDRGVKKARDAVVEVRRLWERLSKKSGSIAKEEERRKALEIKKRMIEDYVRAARGYQETRGKLSKGIDFYSKLADQAEQLKTQADVALGSRRSERQSLRASLQSSGIGSQRDIMQSHMRQVDTPPGSSQPTEPRSYHDVGERKTSQEEILERLKSLSMEGPPPPPSRSETEESGGQFYPTSQTSSVTTTPTAAPSAPWIPDTSKMPPPNVGYGPTGRSWSGSYAQTGNQAYGQPPVSYQSHGQYPVVNHAYGYQQQPPPPTSAYVQTSATQSTYPQVPLGYPNQPHQVTARYPNQPLPPFQGYYAPRDPVAPPNSYPAATAGQYSYPQIPTGQQPQTWQNQGFPAYLQQPPNVQQPPGGPGQSDSSLLD